MSDEPIHIWVPGLPTTQGSLRAYAIKGGGARVVQGASPAARAHLDDWRSALAMVARAAMRGEPLLEGPLDLNCRFWLARRRSTPKLKPTWPCKGRSLDLDKLVRAVCDALTGIVFADDAQICDLHAVKAWETEGTGAEVAVSPILYSSQRSTI